MRVLLYVVATILGALACLFALAWAFGGENTGINLGYWRSGPALERRGPTVSFAMLTVITAALGVGAFLGAPPLRTGSEGAH